MIQETKKRLELARHAGADRIYGAVLTPRPGRAEQYELRAVDGEGNVYFRRQLLEPSYFEAVTYWQQLRQTPNVSMLPEGKVA